jgi:hydroxyacyl-ACP dehydratase HTD2-like protein with hotdog domain
MIIHACRCADFAFRNAFEAGERNPAVLASMRDRRCHSSTEVIEKALTGHYQNICLYWNERWRGWIGRTTEASDIVTAQLVRGLRATLFQEIGEPKPGDAAPWTAHWCLAQPVYPMSQLGTDGHPTRGGFLPPVPLPRRMWAGGELAFLDAVRVGDDVTRTSRIADVTMKTGSTGTLCFVAVEHTISSPRGIA